MGIGPFTGSARATLGVMTALVLGFGAFRDVLDNPSSRLARSIDGRIVGVRQTILRGFEMPVSYERCFDQTLALAAEHRPAFVLGFGVAAGRVAALVESTARNRANHTIADVDGSFISEHGSGPLQIESRYAASLANALGLGCSPDAGEYVCNSWMYRVLRAGLPAAFVHLPAEGLDADRVAEGFGRFLDAEFARG
ncbi:hypothetical protein LBMAG42_23760 [Deltaproteobacteria bacterium]|nr:hypothetical protein LBMAG42_23760 [Deltaproteobacteria bacterium]